MNDETNTCQCGPTCTCGCAEGKPCTCGENKSRELKQAGGCCGGHGQGGHGHGEGGGCCGGHQHGEAKPADAKAVEKACQCGSDCTCGCAEGKPCTCGESVTDGAVEQPKAEGGASATYRVSGMTCEHCVKAITEEVEAIDGVRDAQVDLASGKLTVTSEQPIDFDRIVEAVSEAGDYTVE